MIPEITWNILKNTFDIIELKNLKVVFDLKTSLCLLHHDVKFLSKKYNMEVGSGGPEVLLDFFTLMKVRKVGVEWCKILKLGLLHITVPTLISLKIFLLELLFEKRRRTFSITYLFIKKQLVIGVSPTVFSISPFKGLKMSHEFPNFGNFWPFSR